MPRFLRNPWFLLGLGLWQLVVVFTPVSLYGFWADVVMAGATMIWIPAALLRERFMRSHSWAAIITVAACLSTGLFILMPGATMVVEGVMVSEDRTPAKWLDGIWLLNRRFIPEIHATAGCPTGSLRTSKALLFFPLVEFQTQLDPCVPWTEVPE